MLPDISVQDYRDFGQNLGKYTVGATNVPVYKTDGTLSGYLEFPMPDFGAVASAGYATLVSPSHIVSVKHNTGYSSVNFGNGALYAKTYKLINRNEYSNVDFHVPRLDKVVTDAAPVASVEKSDFLSNYKTRYSWYTRVGAGTQSQINEDSTAMVVLANAYSWKTGGTISKASVDTNSTSNYLRYYQLSSDDPDTTLFSISGDSGDSGSPVFAYDSVDNEWKLVGVLIGSDFNNGIYNNRNIIGYLPNNYLSTVLAANTSPDVTDSSADGNIYWGDSAITQGSNSWSWSGLADGYKSLAPSNATTDELDATKDLRFNGDGGVIELQDAVNMGAGKLQFSSDYTVKSADGVSATWVGGGIEVDADKEVLWQVNGLSGDSLHKIGDGTLHVNATGINEGSLNTGAGTVILDQQADASGNKQAFSSVTLVSGRPTVVLADADQISTDNIYFGYRGGTLDLNGNDLSFKKINHTDSGATLLNHSSTSAANLTITGYTSDDVTFNKWTSSGKGTVDNIYQYSNPYSKKTEYFQLNTSSYGYYPTDQTSTSTWTYLGTDASAAVEYRLSQLNNQVFRGFIGETDSDATNGELNVTINQQDNSAKMTLAGGMNLNGNLNVEQGTVILSGQPVAHANSVVIDDDWTTSYFKANQIVVNNDSIFQVGEYAEVTADVVAGESSKIMFGYNNSSDEQDRIWRCYSVINTTTTTCSQLVRTEEEQAALTYSAVTGDVSLTNDASLYLGQVNYLGNVTSTGSTMMTLDSSAYWTMTGNSNVTTLNALSGSHLSMLPSGSWSAKELVVDTLNATGMTLSLGVKPSTAESDKLTIKNSATGDSNVLDVSLMLESSAAVSLYNDVVMVDAPGGTSHDYFTLSDVALGFSIYSPNYQVVDNGDRVQWILQHNAEVEPEPEPTPDTDTTPAASDEAESEEQKGFTPEDWFTIKDNQPLIRQTRALMDTRQYVFSEALSDLNSRASQLRNKPEKSGEWATIEQSKGGWQGLDVTQQTLGVGWDAIVGEQMLGFTVSHTQGKTKGNSQATHSLTSVGINYSWSSATGWFVDAATRYMYLEQELNFDPQLGIRGAKPDSDMLAGSVKSGFEFRTADGSLAIAPYVGFSGGYMSGYTVEGEDAQVALSSATPYFATAGVEVKRSDFWIGHPDVMLTAGIEYQYAPGRAGSELALSDSHSRRQYDAFSDNRYRVYAGIEGRLSQNLAVNAKVKSSFGGTFSTDYSGMVGVAWRF